MKKLLAHIWKFIYSIRHYRKLKELDGYAKKLEKVATDMEVDRLILMHRIVKYMRNYLKVDAQSKYIPFSARNREQSRKQVIGKFGPEMERLGVTINAKLELCAP